MFSPTEPAPGRPEGGGGGLPQLSARAHQEGVRDARTQETHQRGLPCGEEK